MTGKCTEGGEGLLSPIELLFFPQHYRVSLLCLEFTHQWRARGVWAKCCLPVRGTLSLSFPATATPDLKPVSPTEALFCSIASLIRGQWRCGKVSRMNRSALSTRSGFQLSMLAVHQHYNVYRHFHNGRQGSAKLRRTRNEEECRGLPSVVGLVFFSWVSTFFSLEQSKFCTSWATGWSPILVQFLMEKSESQQKKVRRLENTHIDALTEPWERLKRKHMSALELWSAGHVNTGVQMEPRLLKKKELCGYARQSQESTCTHFFAT